MHRISRMRLNPKPTFLVTRASDDLSVMSPSKPEIETKTTGNAKPITKERSGRGSRKRKSPESSRTPVESQGPAMQPRVVGATGASQERVDLALLLNHFLYSGDWRRIARAMGCSDPSPLQSHFRRLMVAAMDHFATDIPSKSLPKMTLLRFVQILYCGILVGALTEGASSSTHSKTPPCEAYLQRFVARRGITAERCVQAMLQARDSAAELLADRAVADALVRHCDIPRLKEIYKKIAILFRESQNETRHATADSLVATLLDKALGLPTPPIVGDFLIPASHLGMPQEMAEEIKQASSSAKKTALESNVGSAVAVPSGFQYQPQLYVPQNLNFGTFVNYGPPGAMYKVNSIMVGPNGIQPVLAHTQKSGVSDFTTVTEALRKMK